MFILGQTGCNLRVLFAERLLTHSPRVCEARNRKVPGKFNEAAKIHFRQKVWALRPS